MHYKEKVDAGRKLQNPMLTGIPATAHPDMTRTKDNVISWREKERFFKSHSP
jgi:hypothetical protein